MLLKGVINGVAVSLILVTTASGVKDQAAHIDYDTFMKGDLDSRISTFQVITSDNKAEIVRTQLDRWLTANRDRLTAEQMALLAENRAFIAAALYEQPRSEAILARAKDLESRSLAVLSREDVGQALTIHGMYIPKP
jgi:hypothetical protein